MGEDPTVHWIGDLEGTSSGELVEVSLTRLEEQIHSQGWGKIRFMLFVVKSMAIGSLGTVSFEIMDDLPSAVQEKPMDGFPIMVDRLVYDIIQAPEEMDWFDEVVGDGFIGWVAAMEGYRSREEQEAGKRIRSLLYYSIDHGFLNIFRHIDNDEVGITWVASNEGEPLSSALQILTEFSHYVRFRNKYIPHQ